MTRCHAHYLESSPTDYLPERRVQCRECGQYEAESAATEYERDGERFWICDWCNGERDDD